MLSDYINNKMGILLNIIIDIISKIRYNYTTKIIRKEHENDY